MKKTILTNAIVLLLSLTAVAQDKKVAVFDPAGSVENYLKEIVREEISSIIVNTGEYTVLERQLINKVLEENKFQSGGLVDDSQISEIGKRMGANVVFVSSITIMGNGNYYISCKMIDVMTARIEKQKTAQTQKGGNDLVNVVQKMVNEMFANTVKPSESSPQPSKPVVESKPAFNTADMLVADGRKVFMNGKELNKNEVRTMMANTDALRYYNKGLSRNKSGNVWIISGICVIGGGLFFPVARPFENNAQDWDLYICIIGMSAGTAMTLTGLTLKITSKSSIRKAVDMYNGGKGKTSNMELKFGFTGNGLGLALVF